MLRLFHKRETLKKWVLAIFMGFTAVGMIGVVTPFFSGGDTSRVETLVLAEIAGQRITSQDLQRTIEARLQNSPFGSDPRIVPAIAGSVLEDMVLRRALENQARKLGLEVSDKELFQSLQTIPSLNVNGQFVGMDRYRDAVQQGAKMTVAEFEAGRREKLEMEKLQDVVADGVRVDTGEVHEEFLKRNAKAKIEYVLFDPGQLLKAVLVNPQVLEKFFKKDPSRYKQPEQRRVRYALVGADAVRAAVNVEEPELRQYYAQHLSDYRVPERVKAARILFKTSGKSADEVATIEKTARDVLGQLRSGKDFGELAKKYSEDATASTGGDLGWIVRGQAVPEFETAVFSMRPGQVSDLIKTIYGIDIVKLLEKQTAHLQTFEEVKEGLRSMLETGRLQAAEQTLADKLEGELKGNAAGFEAVIKKAGLEVKETPLFKYNQKLPDFGDSQSFADLAYQLPQGSVGQPISVPKGVAIIQVTEIVPEHVPRLDEVRARAEEDYRADQSKILAVEKAREFAGRVKTGDFAKIARAAGYKPQESKDFSSQDYVEGLGSGAQLTAAFTLAPGVSSDVVSLGTTSVVFRVVSHTQAPEADFAAQQDSIGEELLERKRNLAFDIYRKNLKKKLSDTGELKMNDAALQQFLASYKNR